MYISLCQKCAMSHAGAGDHAVQRVDPFKFDSPEMVVAGMDRLSLELSTGTRSGLWACTQPNSREPTLASNVQSVRRPLS